MAIWGTRIPIASRIGGAVARYAQAWSQRLHEIAQIRPGDGVIIVGNGTGWEAGRAADALGLGTIATQDANSVTISGGSITGITDLAVADGGTGASTAANARTNLGLVIGTNVQAWDADLDTLAGLAKTDSNFIVGNGSAWVAESGATARTSLGVGTGDNVQVARIGAGTAPSFLVHASGSPGSGLPAMKINVATAYAAARGLGIELADNASATADYFVYFEDHDGGGATVQGSISGDGGTGVNYNDTSDQRRKRDIRDADLPDALGVVRGLRVRDWGGPDPSRPKARTQRGFIAQELHAVYPEAVIPGHTVTREDGSAQEIPWQITPMKLIPVLVAALQAQDAQIAALTARITALEAKP